MSNNDSAPTKNSKLKNKNSIEVSAALIFHNGKLLITQRHAKAHLGGLWEFPGGKREAGESFEQCLVREIREELGIEVGVGKLVEAVTHEYPEKIVHLKFFHCAWLREEPRTLDCQDFAWVEKEQLGDYVFPEADKVLLQNLLATPEFWRQEKMLAITDEANQFHRKSQ
jgi:mutator protein MutT